MPKGDLSLRAAVIAVSFLMCACGGGGAGGGPNVLPPPPAPPSPPPPPPASADAAPFGVGTDTTFATAGDDFQIRWDNEAKVYELQVSGAAWEALTRYGSFGVATEYYPPNGEYVLRVRDDLPYQYTKLADVADNAWGMPMGQFAFGLPTSKGSVPTTGTATYGATLYGSHPDGVGRIEGSASLSFDFAAGTLGGHLNPVWTDPSGLGFDDVSLGQYTFVNTVFSSGSTTFSGQLSNPSVSGLGSFDGLFTGPAAKELMARWSAPMLDPFTNKQTDISGVLIGNR